MFLSHLGENCGILFLLYQAKKADNVPECAGGFFHGERERRKAGAMMKLYIAKWQEELYYYTVDDYDHIYDLYPQSMLTETAEGNIYIGVVQEKKNAISSAFVNIGEENIGFLPYSDITEEIKSGDSILVQAVRSSSGQKGAKLSMKFSLEGSFAVLLSGEDKLYFSQKMEKAKRQRLEAFLQEKERNYGFIIRSGAEEETALWQEMQALQEMAKRLQERAKYGKGPCLLRGRENLDILKNAKEVDEIYTNDRSSFEQAVEYVKQNGLPVAVHYRETDYALRHDLAGALAEAEKTKIWLSGGGYLILEKTEAMNVIDVNTGKTKGGKDHEKTVFKTNLEAAKEVARQIRLRNLSGMILIDFIDMKQPVHQRELLAKMAAYLATDPVPALVHDLTKLGIMELTRKKKYDSLAVWAARQKEKKN